MVAAAWFYLVFPGGWTRQAATQRNVIGLYTLGLALQGIGGVFVPLVAGSGEDSTTRALAAAEERVGELEDERERLERERDELESEVERLESEREEGESARNDLERERDELRSERDDLDDELAVREAELAAVRASKARFELYEDRGGKWRWRLRHRNGNVIADGGQGYASKQKAQQGMHSVMANATGAGVFVVEPEDEAEGEPELGVAPDDTDPEAVEEDVPVPVESKATFELYEDDAGEWRWRLVHDNGNVIADSGEGYASKQKARQGMASVRGNVQQADYLRVDPAAFEVYRDRGGKWRWRLIHENGNILADGSQGYASRAGARKGIDSVKTNVGDADVVEGER